MVVMVQIDFIHSAPAVGTWSVQKEFEIAAWQTSCDVEFWTGQSCYPLVYWNLKVFL